MEVTMRIRRVAIAPVLLGLLFAVGCKPKGLRVTSMEPSKGSYMGGDKVFIKGSGFQTETRSVKVYFGTRSADAPVIESDSSMLVTVPKGEIDQEVVVKLIFNDSRTIELPQKFKYTNPFPDQNWGDKKEEAKKQ